MMMPNILCPRNVLSPRLLNVSTAKIGVVLSTVFDIENILSLNDNCAKSLWLAESVLKENKIKHFLLLTELSLLEKELNKLKFEQFFRMFYKRVA